MAKQAQKQGPVAAWKGSPEALPSLQSGSRCTLAGRVARELSHASVVRHEHRDRFVSRVYALMAVALTLTVANTILALLIVSPTLEAPIRDAMTTLVYLSIAVTLFLWTIVTFICNRTSLDFTVHKLFIWSSQLLWVFVFIGLWMFTGVSNYMILWTVLGLVINLLELTVDTQMVLGGSRLSHQFDSHQYMLAFGTLFWDVLVLFVLQLPLQAVIISSILALFGQ